MPSLSPVEPFCLDALRAQVRSIEASTHPSARQVLPFGIEEIDERLAGHGLALAALHELSGASSGLGDDAAATLFAAGIAARLSDEGGTVLWALARRDLFAPALAQAGLPPERLVYAECRSDEDVLAVMEEGLRHGSLAAVIGDVGRVGMTATRRLQLSAENGGTTALMLKRWRRNGQDPLGAPSAAASRWRIGCVPSQPLAVSGIARSRWHIELVRQRGGPGHQWIMEGTDEAGRLAVPAAAEHRAVAAVRARAAA